MSKQKDNVRFESLKTELQKWTSALKDLSQYIDPTRGIFDGDRTRIGKMINHKILLDSHATHAKRITASGMQTGMTDPSRPWFKLTVDNILLESVPGVREWIDEVTRIMIEAMNKSNIYKVFQNCYDELVTFGTGCFLILDDFDDVIRGRSFTAGEYYLATDNKGRVNRFARSFEMTVDQLVQEFGLESVSPKVRAAYDNNQRQQSIKVRHLIEPNKDRDTQKTDYMNMPYRSCYWEEGDGTEQYLAKRGFRRFPVVAPRWDAITTDMVYGYGPGWHAIGDIKELQVTHKDMLIAQEKLGNPPLVEDSSVVGNTNKLPGGITKTNSAVPNTGVRAAFQVDPRLDAFYNAIEFLHKKIDKHLFADIFLMISASGDQAQTAFEIAKREQEKMMMLGPILHGLNEEMHDESIDIIFDIVADAGLIPPPPQEIEGMELKVQYISILAQAQRALGVQAMDRVIGRVGNLAALGQPQAWDNIDIDELVRESSDMEGTPAKLVMDKAEVESIRQVRLEQQNKLMAMQAANSGADTAQKLSQATVNGEEKNMLDVVGETAKAAR